MVHNLVGMFGGKDMAKMMKQMGVDMDELDADKVEIHMGDEKIVFTSPSVSKIDAQGKEMFQLEGKYSREEKDSQPEVKEEDIELVREKTDASEQEAREVLMEAEDPADAIMELR